MSVEPDTTNDNASPLIRPDAFLGKPVVDRSEAEKVMTALIEGESTTNDLVFGQGPFVLSDIPLAAKDNGNADKLKRGGGVCLGIDEAGRGSVLGPMIYGCAYWPKPASDAEEKKVFGDSKKLTEERRTFLWKNHILKDKSIGFAVRVLTAAEISRNMWRTPDSYNLNQMSHDSAIQIIQRLLDEGVDVQHCYIDTVGDAFQYKRLLERVFSNYSITFIVEPKADDKYPCCSAASVVAKVTRDSIIQHLSSISEQSLGSGYPSDPTCQAWIRHQLGEHNGCCPLFGFSHTATPFVRFSWNPIKQAFEKHTGGTRTLTFQADDQDEDETYEAAEQKKRQRKSMQAFLGNKKHLPRLPYMERKGLKVVSDL